MSHRDEDDDDNDGSLGLSDEERMSCHGTTESERGDDSCAVAGAAAAFTQSPQPHSPLSTVLLAVSEERPRFRPNEQSNLSSSFGPPLQNRIWQPSTTTYSQMCHPKPQSQFLCSSKVFIRNGSLTANRYFHPNTYFDPHSQTGFRSFGLAHRTASGFFPQDHGKGVSLRRSESLFQQHLLRSSTPSMLSRQFFNQTPVNGLESTLPSPDDSFNESRRNRNRKVRSSSCCCFSPSSRIPSNASSAHNTLNTQAHYSNHLQVPSYRSDHHVPHPLPDFTTQLSRRICLALLFATYVTVFLAALLFFTNGKELGLFHNTFVEAVSLSPTSLQPTRVGYAIFCGILYAWNLVWILWAMSITCQSGNGCFRTLPPILTVVVFMEVFQALLAVLLWLPLIDSNAHMACLWASCLSCVAFTLALATLTYNLSVHANLLRQTYPRELTFLKVFAQNGLGALSAWSLFESLLALHTSLVYNAFHLRQPPEPGTCASLVLGLAGLIVTIGFFIDILVLEHSLRFLLTPYLVIIWSVCSILVREDHTNSSHNLIGLVLLALGCALFVCVKFILGIYHTVHRVEQARDHSLLQTNQKLEDSRGEIQMTQSLLSPEVPRPPSRSRLHEGESLTPSITNGDI